MRIVVYSQTLTVVGSRYLNTEREGLAVLRCQEEARWLVTGSEYPMKFILIILHNCRYCREKELVVRADCRRGL